MAKMNKNANYVTDKTQVAQKQAAKIKSSQKTKEITKQVLIITAIVLAVAAVITGFVFWMVGISQLEEREFKAPIPGNFEVTDIVELEFDGYGTVKIELYGKEAPKTVENFLSLVESGNLAKEILTISSYTNRYITIGKEHDHSNNDCVHESIKGEFYDNAFENRISHVEGVLTMNAGDGLYTSSTTDFKILTDDCSDDYDGKYAAFGKVIDGGLAKIQKMVKDYQEKASSSSSSSSSVDTGDFKVGSNKFTITDADIKKETIDYTFIPTVSGKYTFKHTAEKRFESIMVVAGKASDGAKSAEFGTEIKILKDGVEFELEKGETYTITFKFAEYALATSYYVTLETDILFAGENTVEVTNEQIQNKENITYYYTANMTGVHSFTDKDGDLEDLIEIFDGENSLGKNSAYLEEGKTYSVVILVETLSADDFEVTIAEPIIILGDNKLEVPEYTIRDGKAYYYFTAKADSKYLFTNKDLEIAVYDKDGNLLEGDGYVDLKKDETYKIEVKADLSLSLIIGKNNIVLTEDNKIKDKTEYEKEYTFVAESTGKYTFTANNVTFKLFNGSTEVKKAEDGTYSLTAGKSYKVVANSPSVSTDAGYELTIAVEEAKDTIVVTKSYTLKVQDAIIEVGENKLTITKTDIDNKNVTYTFKATTNGPFLFTAKYQRLNDKGEWVKEDGKYLNDVTKEFKVYDKDGKELNIEYAMLTKGETYTLVLETSEIKENAIATITFNKIAPKLVSAKIASANEAK